MGSQVKIGDRIFNAVGRGALKQSEVTQNQVRWVCNSTITALIAPGNTATFAATINVVPGTKLIVIKNMIATAIFIDSSTGASYNLSHLINLYLYQVNFANLDYDAGAGLPVFPSQAGGIPYEILCGLNGVSFAVDVRLFGGDVLAGALVTPAAGDQVQFGLSVLYEPL